MSEKLTEEQQLEIVKEAISIVSTLKQLCLLRMEADEGKFMGERHLAFSIAVEAMRKALVLQYGEHNKDIIFRAADKLIKSEDDTTKRPAAKA